MPFYPIIQAPYCIGRTVVHNFPANNWEKFKIIDRYVNVTYLDKGIWKSETIQKIKSGQSLGFSKNDLGFDNSNESPILLSLSDYIIQNSEHLRIPDISLDATYYPVHRGSIKLISDYTSTSYQGEIIPFPSTGSFLSFPSFIQKGMGIENYMLLLNIENEPSKRKEKVYFFEANTRNLMGSIDVFSNYLNLIDLDQFCFDSEDLPIILCKKMSFVPLFFSTEKKGKFMSLEHTHPPASFAVHGERFLIQKYIKNFWFEELKI